MLWKVEVEIWRKRKSRPRGAFLSVRPFIVETVGNDETDAWILANEIVNPLSDPSLCTRCRAVPYVPQPPSESSR